MLAQERIKYPLARSDSRQIRLTLESVLGDKTQFLQSAKASFQQFHDPEEEELTFENAFSLVTKLCENLKLPPIEEERMRDIFSRYDRNEDLRLNFREFSTMYWKLLNRIRDKYYPWREFEVSREKYINRVLIKKAKIDEVFEFERKMGAGSFGEVHLVREKKANLLRVCKIINKNQATIPVEQIEAEINVLKQLDHPNIIKIFDIYEDEDNVYILMEKCEGGELMDRVSQAQARQKTLTENYVRVLMKQMLHALAYFHSKRVVHKDLKPENILFQDTSVDAPLKIIDFGLAEIFSSSEDACSHNAAGTVLYMAPEVFQRRLDYKCDVWSAACIMYLLLTSHLPFTGTTASQVRSKVMKEHPSYHTQCKHLSRQAVDLLKSLFERDPKVRLSATQALKHPWFKIVDKTDVSKQIELLDVDGTGVLGLATVRSGPQRAGAPGSDADGAVAERLNPDDLPSEFSAVPLLLPSRILQNLHDFARQSPLRNILVNLMAHQLDLHSSNEIKRIARVFADLDADRDGSISNEEIFAALKTSGTAPWDSNRIVQAIDVDNDGWISFTEFLAAAYTWKESDKNIVYGCFHKLDTEGKGLIELGNFVARLVSDNILETRVDEIYKHVNAVDTKKDGVIDEQEFHDFVCGIKPSTRRS